jgi:hypothetical protein
MKSAVVLLFVFFLSFVFLVPLDSESGVLVKQVREADSVEIESIEYYHSKPKQKKHVLRSSPFILSKSKPPSEKLYEEILFQIDALPEFYQAALLEMPHFTSQVVWPGAEVRTLVSQGPSRNRIDLPIVGDGYTLEEKERFFEDAQRITNDLFQGQTFSSYLPLFNVHAVFVPSRDSGITDGSDRRDTALGLYRNPPGSKRAVMPGNTRTIDRAIRLAPDSDYPILLANDDYYGGLGGKYAITTRSYDSGSMVLRHELGHNFGDVGEEYDGGFVYRGANFSRTTNVSWSHWVDAGKTSVNYARFLNGSYVWENLKEGPVRVEFEFPAPTQNGSYQLRTIISSVGWATPEDVHAYLNGQRVQLNGVFTTDRSFFEIVPDSSLAPGPHVLQFKENIHDGDNVLAFAQIYALEPNYDKSPAKVGAFNSFNSSQHHVGYRPTDTACLMKDMRSTEFCSVDKENMWLRFLSRVSLIDDLEVERIGSGVSRVSLQMPPLENLEVRWYRLNEWNEKRHLAKRDSLQSWETDELGRYRVEVVFRSPEIRKESAGVRATRDFEVR